MPPDTATSTRSPGAIMSNSSMALAHLVAAELEEVLGAEVGVVAADVDDRRLAAHAALHAAPPEMTGRISTTSSSASTASPGTSVSPRMTSTDSRLSSSRPRSLATRHRAGDLELAAGVAQEDLHRRHHCRVPGRADRAPDGQPPGQARSCGGAAHGLRRVGSSRCPICSASPGFSVALRRRARTRCRSLCARRRRPRLTTATQNQPAASCRGRPLLTPRRCRKPRARARAPLPTCRHASDPPDLDDGAALAALAAAQQEGEQHTSDGRDHRRR